MFTKGGNSGVKYFVKEGLTTNGNYGYRLEYQILDHMNHPWMLEGKMQPNDYHSAGSLNEFFPASETKMVKPLGEWAYPASGPWQPGTFPKYSNTSTIKTNIDQRDPPVLRDWIPAALHRLFKLKWCNSLLLLTIAE